MKRKKPSVALAWINNSFCSDRKYFCLVLREVKVAKIATPTVQKRCLSLGSYLIYEKNLPWITSLLAQSFAVIALAITIHPLVFSTEKDSQGFCCNYILGFIDVVKETVCSANKANGPCWGRQLWASLWLWLGQSKVKSLVQVLGRRKRLFRSKSQIWLGTETWAGLILLASVIFALTPSCLYAKCVSRSQGLFNLKTA